MYIEFRENMILLKECRYDKEKKRGKTKSIYLASNVDQAIREVEKICKKDEDLCKKLVKEIEKKQNDYALKRGLKSLKSLYEKLPQNAKITKDILRVINKYEKKGKLKTEPILEEKDE